MDNSTSRRIAKWLVGSWAALLLAPPVLLVAVLVADSADSGELVAHFGIGILVAATLVASCGIGLLAVPLLIAAVVLGRSRRHHPEQDPGPVIAYFRVPTVTILTIPIGVIGLGFVAVGWIGFLALGDYWPGTGRLVGGSIIGAICIGFAITFRRHGLDPNAIGVAHPLQGALLVGALLLGVFALLAFYLDMG